MVAHYLSDGIIRDIVCGGLAQSVECVVSNDEARGSKPRFSTFGRLACKASIAQMVERKTLNLVVVGSIPTGGANRSRFSSVGRASD